MSCSIWTGLCSTAISTISFRRGVAASLCGAPRSTARRVSRRTVWRCTDSVEGELAWTDLHYWTQRVGIDVVAMTKELDHMIGFLCGAEEFLQHLRQLGKRVTIVTNAHESGVAIKVAKTGLDRHVDRIVNAFEVGYLKMRPEYWPQLSAITGIRSDKVSLHG